MAPRGGGGEGGLAGVTECILVYGTRIYTV